MTKETIKKDVQELVDSLGINAEWKIVNSPIFKLPVRKAEISRSPWYKESRPNYCVCFYYDDKLMECENGLTPEAAVKSIYCWYLNSGFLLGRPYEVEVVV